MGNLKEGYWAIATQKHLKNYKPDSPHLDEFDSLNVAGKAGRLLGIIRGNSIIDNVKKLEKMASSVGIGKQELHRTILPEIEKASDQQVEIKRNSTGDFQRLEEYVLANNQVLGITGQVYENLNPSDIERIAVETLDQTKKIPLLQSELMNLLAGQTFTEEDIYLACSLQEQFRLIQKLTKTKGKEPIYSNEYVWGPNHEKIAMTVSSLDLGKKHTLRDVVDTIQNYQGYPLEKLPILDVELLDIAKKVGMINPTTISSKRGISKEFAFSTNLLEISGYNDDILDDVKVLLASIRFGQNYTEHSTIFSPERFLSNFISRMETSPHSANGTDYILLEKRGIVQVQQVWGDRYKMKLIKKDVAQEALKIIKDPLFNMNFSSDRDHAHDILAVQPYDNFKSPEEYRLEMGKSTENVAEAMDYLTRVLRDENL
ncbi:hypothetical protein [Paenibacillus sp. sgz500992]|uniref:hypothetical protein n=1 Tax=Paenibacillus sp. sgz500992 TaxID=3242476 RepID=UPI0036D365CD